MNPTAVGFLVFALVFTGALAGMALRRALPEDHLGQDAKDSMRLAIGLVVTMTGLVLGMLVSSAKTYYDGQKNIVAAMSSEVIILNNSLAVFGPEADPARIEARHFVEGAVDRIWPHEKSRSFELRPKNNSKTIAELLQLLVPKNELQAVAKAQIAASIQTLSRSYWVMFLQSEQASIPLPLLIVVTAWLITIFVSFGIFAPPNFTVIATLIICAAAVSGAIFIIMEMYSPFGGILRISPAVVRDALDQMVVTP
jgi:hypothetical protein